MEQVIGSMVLRASARLAARWWDACEYRELLYGCRFYASSDHTKGAVKVQYPCWGTVFGLCIHKWSARAEVWSVDELAPHRVPTSLRMSALRAMTLSLMLRSHLERDPAEFVELKIWASSESSPGFGRALCDSHIQIGRLAYIFRTEACSSPSELWRTPAGRRPNALPICRISGWPWAVNAISSAGHVRAPAECMFHGKVRARWRHSAGPAPALRGGRVARGVQNCWKSSQLFNSAWKCDEEWAIPKFWQRSHRSTHEFTDSSPDLLVFLVARTTFTYSF